MELERPLAKTTSPRSGSFASFKSVCALIKQRSGEEPSFLTPGLSTTAVDAKNLVVRNRGAGNGIAGRGTDACAAMWTTTARTRLNEHHAITSGKAVGGSPARLAAPNRQVFFLPCTRRVTSAA
jgi:hypothetical protein